MGLFAIGSSALGISLGVDVKVLNEAPGPHSIIAWKPGAGSTACGIVVTDAGVHSGLLMGRDRGRGMELLRLGTIVKVGGSQQQGAHNVMQVQVVACAKSHPAEI
jgi:hypothetical protein